ncbi:hypothetical protein EVAR_73974_1 [Eumeta japonica]|uniref:Uncharacterized protein n=1 Tax=Eumeta variegata TaxID=151549 RepID=A0A4C1SVQ9_EUMVA|nr:hypothetical protein EVAR_73974_1 [Eumeta japonica]
MTTSRRRARASPRQRAPLQRVVALAGAIYHGGRRGAPTLVYITINLICFFTGFFHSAYCDVEFEGRGREFSLDAVTETRGLRFSTQLTSGLCGAIVDDTTRLTINRVRTGSRAPRVVLVNGALFPEL